MSLVMVNINLQFYSHKEERYIDKEKIHQFFYRLSKSQGVELLHLKISNNVTLIIFKLPNFVMISLTRSGDKIPVLCTNTVVDWPNAQVCQFERKEEQAFPEYSLAQHLEILSLGTTLHDKSSCEQFWKYKKSLIWHKL